MLRKKTLAGNGQFLHAQTLGFYHPRTNKWLEFSVEPPKIFQEMLKKNWLTVMYRFSLTLAKKTITIHLGSKVNATFNPVQRG